MEGDDVAGGGDVSEEENVADEDDVTGGDHVGGSDVVAEVKSADVRDDVADEEIVDTGLDAVGIGIADAGDGDGVVEGLMIEVYTILS